MVITRWIISDILNGIQVFNTEEEALKEKDEILTEHPELKSDLTIQNIEVKMSGSELQKAHRELEIRTIADDITERWTKYDPMYDYDVWKCAEDVYEEMLNDDYVMEIYDNALYEHTEKAMENRGLV